MRLLELVQSLVSELGIVTASLSQYIPIYTSGMSLEISLSLIFTLLIIYALLLTFLSLFRVWVGTILTPSWTPFPRQGVGVVAFLAGVVAIDFIQFAGILP